MNASMCSISKQCAPAIKLNAAIRIVKGDRVERESGRGHAFLRPAGDAECFRAVNRAVNLAHAMAAALLHHPIHVMEVNSDGCQ